MKIKDADINDSLDVFTWRNDPVSCQMFISNNVVTLEEHKKWFESSLTNQLRKIYIGIVNEGKVGICRFDTDKKMSGAEVSINLNPSMRGKNLAYDFLANSIEKYRTSNTIKLTATIKKENKASLRIFERYGFIKIDEDDNFFYLTRTD
ncbi:GNAT family N-acetyltransferase [Janthinobacterium sp. GW458P]|uniref:GNAT family N-acetyltransferase n=1 Tax=Janthinobacterium sp. GW458P TaxID=1981504 RepID=UPI000A323FA6|nr:GNAT family N-acetyltransferase [Janthinobacterium sp. GW458P]MBE3024361.1 GNAT family N-acetyltransferase [Janthinobacterium sp. GW458P]